MVFVACVHKRHLPGDEPPAASTPSVTCELMGHEKYPLEG
jgi:hypothetical protein